MSKPRMTMARLDAGERGTFADQLRKVKWFLSGYPSYRTALFYDEHRHQITDWVEDESLSREEVIARFEALMPTTTVAPAFVHGHNLTVTPGTTYSLTREGNALDWGGMKSTYGSRVDGPGSVSGPLVGEAREGRYRTAMWENASDDPSAVMAIADEEIRRAAMPNVRMRMRAQKVQDTLDDIAAIHQPEPGATRNGGTTDFCRECGDLYPCATIQAIRGSESPTQGADDA